MDKDKEGQKNADPLNEAGTQPETNVEGTVQDAGQVDSGVTTGQEDPATHEPSADVVDNDVPPLTDEELAAQSEESKNKGKDKKEMFTREEVAQLLEKSNNLMSEKFSKQVEEIKASIAAGKAPDAEVEELELSTLRLPRFNGQYLICLKNQETDDFFKEERNIKNWIVSLYDEKMKQFRQYQTAILEDGTELMLPSDIMVAQLSKRTVKCQIKEIKKVDKSYSEGKVQQVVYRDDLSYDQTRNGPIVNQKVTKFDYTYVVITPEGKELTVTPEVVNW